MTNFLICRKDRKGSRWTSIEVCRRKCPLHDECAEREQFEIDEMLADERHKQIVMKKIKKKYANA